MTCLILLVMAIEDARTLKVNDYLQVVLLMSILFSEAVNVWSLVASIVIYTLCYILRKRYENKLGGADIKIFCSLLLLGFSKVVFIMFLASLIGLVYSWITARPKIPFVPFIWVGYILVNV